MMDENRFQVHSSLPPDYLVVIDKTRYITLKTYGLLMGISPSRVSQLKMGLPVEHIAGLNIDLINLDRLELQQDLSHSADVLISTPQKLDSYSLDELGTYFQGILLRSRQQVGEAQEKLAESEALSLAQADELLELKDRIASAEDLLLQAGLQANEDRLAHQALVSQLDTRYMLLEAELGGVRAMYENASEDHRQRMLLRDSEIQGLNVALTALKGFLSKQLTGEGTADEPVEPPQVASPTAVRGRKGKKP